MHGQTHNGLTAQSFFFVFASPPFWGPGLCCSGFPSLFSFLFLSGALRGSCLLLACLLAGGGRLCFLLAFFSFFLRRWLWPVCPFCLPCWLWPAAFPGSGFPVRVAVCACWLARRFAVLVVLPVWSVLGPGSAVSVCPGLAPPPVLPFQPAFSCRCPPLAS